MNIIYSTDIDSEFKTKLANPDLFVILELFTISNEKLNKDGIKAYALMQISEFSGDVLEQAKSMEELHNKMIKHLEEKNYDFVKTAIEHLESFWPDPFMQEYYQDILTRINNNNPPHILK